jgi:transposase
VEQDRAPVVLSHHAELLATLFGQFPFLETLFADSAYQAPIFANALVKILPGLETEIVRRSDHAKGFVRLPKRWIVERTIAWLNRFVAVSPRIGKISTATPSRS